jgi:hypothetical protein
MKAILEFNLPEESVEWGIHKDAEKMYSVIWEMDQYLRSIYKNGVDDINQDAAYTIREHLNYLLSQEGIIL